MRILDENELVSTRGWESNHAHEIQEVKAFIDSKAHRAELEMNPKYSPKGQRSVFEKALSKLVGYQKTKEYDVFTKKGHVYIVWLKWEEQHD